VVDTIPSERRLLPDTSSPPLRRSQGLASEIARYRKDYCIRCFLAELDKRTGTGEPTSAAEERRISYVLKTAPTGRPDQSFKLPIDAAQRSFDQFLCRPA